MLGDAVHPMPAYLAQGACQAIEDAAALADALNACPGPDRVTEALGAYEAQRAPRAARVQRARQVWDAGTDWLYAPSLTGRRFTVLVVNGPVVNGPPANGPPANGPPANGPAANGPAANGPVICPEISGQRICG